MSRTYHPLKIITIAALVILYVYVALWAQTNLNPRFPSDIGIYLQAGKRTLQDVNPYQPFEIGASFVYPPSALLLFSPLSVLPASTAKLLWAALNAWMYLCTFALLWLSIRPALKGYQWAWVAGSALLFAPFLESWTIGQANALILLGLAAFVWGLVDRRRERAGDWGLALAISIKMTPVILLAIPIARKDWRRCIRVLAGVAALSAISGVLFGATPWVGFLEVLPRVFRGYPDPINQSLRPLAQWLLSGTTLSVQVSTWLAVWLGRAFSIAVLGIWIASAFLLPSGKSPLALASLGIVTMTISSSLIWFHHLVFLTIPLAYLILGQEAGQRAWIPRLGWAALGLIQLDRLVEFRFGMPPLLAIAGYLLIYVASLVTVLDARH
jgi:alpha-1,2-mannosyltransferase